MEKEFLNLHDEISGIYENENETENKNVTKKNAINGKPLTFKTGEVAEMLNESPAMIRYYCREFEEFIGIKHNPGEHRIFTEREIEYLRYIIYLLKVKRLTVRQAKEFLSSPQGKLMAPIENNEDKAKIFVEVISNQLKEEISKIIRNEIAVVLKEIEQPLLAISSTLESNKVEEMLQKTLEDNESIKEELKKISTITENETKRNAKIEKIEEEIKKIESLSESIQKVSENFSKVDQFISEYRLKMTESSNEKKGFFSRLFKK